MIKIRGSASDGCSLRVLKITAPKLQAMGGYFFLLMNVRIAIIVVINESTNAENCNSSAKVMYPIPSPPSEKSRRKKEI